LNKKVELLAPASSLNSAIIAINAGANALYLGLNRFNARMKATNFNLEELAKLVKYAHIRCVKIYLAFNTLVYQSEWAEAIKLIDDAIGVGIDAIILQDLGILNYIHQVYPNFEIHASTQMNVKSVDEALFLKKHGVKRIILAREVSLEKALEIKKQTNLEIEVFVHGALCACFSGSCQISRVFESRSGNRGICAQICRYKMSLYTNDKKVDEGYLLSMKELNNLNNINKLVSSVDSIKIEGRNRGEEYVYQVISSYREALDSYYNNKPFDYEYHNKLISNVFNRMFTKGYLFNESPNNIINKLKPNNQGQIIGKVLSYNRGYVTIKLSNNLMLGDGIRILSKIEYGKNVDEIIVNKVKVNKATTNEVISIPWKEKANIDDVVVLTQSKERSLFLKQFLRHEAKLVSLNLTIIKKDNQIEITLTDGINIFNKTYELSDNTNTSYSNLLIQLNRLGNTPYYYDNTNTNIKEEDLLNITLANINKIRQEYISYFDNIRSSIKVYKKLPFIINPNNIINNKELSVKVSKQSSLDFINKNYQIPLIYYKYGLNIKVKPKTKYIPFFSRFTPGINDSLLNVFSNVKGHIDNYFNITNIGAASFIYNNISFQNSTIFLSNELSDKELALILNENKLYHFNLGKVIYGKTELMIFKDIFNLDYNKDNYLNIGKHKVSIKKDQDNLILYNTNLELLDKKIIKYYFDMGLNNLRVDFLDENESKIKLILDKYIN